VERAEDSDSDQSARGHNDQSARIARHLALAITDFTLDKSSSLYIARALSETRRGELCRWEVDPVGNSGAQKAIGRGSAEEEVQKHRDRVRQIINYAPSHCN